jgi:hypothetical protein
LVKSATKGLNLLYNPLRERTPVRLSAVLLALPAKLKEQVKAEFSKPIIAILASGKPETKDDLLVREQMDRAETFELQQAFDDYCWSFKRKWVAEKNGKSFKTSVTRDWPTLTSNWAAPVTSYRRSKVRIDVP